MVRRTLSLSGIFRRTRLTYTVCVGQDNLKVGQKEARDQSPCLGTSV